MKKPARAGFLLCRWFLEGLDVVRLQALRTALHFELDLLALFQGLEARHLDRGVMREQILAALARSDEAKAFGVVEPLDGTGCHYLPLSTKKPRESGRDEAGHEGSSEGTYCHYERCTEEAAVKCWHNIAD